MAPKSVLEWKCDTIETANATVTNGRIALGLRDDQVAEIHKVHSRIAGSLGAGADDKTAFHMMLSMDPDVNDDPSDDEMQEDGEIFFENSLSLDRDLTTSGQSDIREDTHMISDFDPPVLVGTDLGQVVKGDAAELGSFWTRVYFTRRKATSQEQVQVLLKRR